MPHLLMTVFPIGVTVASWLSVSRRYINSVNDDFPKEQVGSFILVVSVASRK